MLLKSFRQNQQAILKKNKFASLIPVLDFYEKEKVFLVEGGLSFFFICQPICGITDGLESIANSIHKEIIWPADTTANISLVALRNQSRVYEGWKSIRHNRMSPEDHDFEGALNQILINYMDTTRESPLKPTYNDLYARNFEVWYSVTVPTNKQIPTEKELGTIVNLSRKLKSKLIEMGLQPEQANLHTWLNKTQSIFNRGQSADWRKNDTKIRPSMAISEQVLENGRTVSVDRDGIVLRGSMSSRKYENGAIRVLTVTRRPDYLNFGDMFGLISDYDSGNSGLFDDFMLTLKIHYPKQSKARRDFATKRTLVTNQAFGPMLKYSNNLRYQYEDMKTIQHELEQEGERLLDMSLQINLLTDLDNADERVERAIAYLTGKRYTFTQDSAIALPMLISSLPCCHNFDAGVESLLARSEIYTTKATPYMMPIFGSWKGNSLNPPLIYHSRDGQVVGIDLFNTSGGYNMAIAARTGSGKSVQGGQIIKALLTTGEPSRNGSVTEDGAQVFAVDAGKSYFRLTEQFKSARFIDFGKKTEFSLDPFADIEGLDFDDPDDAIGTADKITMILTQLKIMASPSGDIKDYQDSRMLDILMQMCRTNPEEASITKFRDLCLADSDQRIIDIGYQLGAFAQGGIHFSRFDRRAAPPLNFDSRFLVFELQDLKSQPHLQTVILMAVVQQAQDYMIKKGDMKKRFFLIDEAWEYIGESAANSNNQFFSAFMEAGWRRFRKSNCAGCCITQQISDYYQTSVGRAIYANSAWKLTMAQNTETINRLVTEKMIPEDGWLGSLMKTIRTVPGVFAETLIDFEGVQQVCRSYADTKSNLIHSTKPSDTKLISSFMQKGLSLADAVAEAAKIRDAEEMAALV